MSYYCRVVKEQAVLTAGGRPFCALLTRTGLNLFTLLFSLMSLLLWTLPNQSIDFQLQVWRPRLFQVTGGDELGGFLMFLLQMESCFSSASSVYLAFYKHAPQRAWKYVGFVLPFIAVSLINPFGRTAGKRIICWLWMDGSPKVFVIQGVWFLLLSLYLLTLSSSQLTNSANCRKITGSLLLFLFYSYIVGNIKHFPLTKMGDNYFNFHHKLFFHLPLLFWIYPFSLGWASTFHLL